MSGQNNCSKTVRHCELCLSTDKRHLHRQHFLHSDNTRAYYDIVACKCCGFVFADHIPSAQDEQDYYVQNGRHQHAVALPPGLASIHESFFRHIASRISIEPALSVLDIGSSVGHFLAHFKSSGCTRLLGIEPSSGATGFANTRYGIDVLECTLGEFVSNEPFDLVTMCGVLEHIGELRSWLAKAASVNRHGGHLFVAVPDAGSFAQQTTGEPFLEFAEEHINFFTENSLARLVAPFGYEALAAEKVANDFYGNTYLLQIFRRSTAPGVMPPPGYDTAGVSGMEAYIGTGVRRTSAIESVLAPAIEAGNRCAIWGAGSLLSRLCATTRILEANIVAVIDRNAPPEGSRFLDKPLCQPDWLESNQVDTVIITSYVYHDEIRHVLRTEIGFKGHIIGMPS